MQLLSHIVRYKLLLPGLLFLGLSACGGQPKLEEGQAVAQAPEPEVVQNTDVDVVWKVSSAGTKSGGDSFTPAVEGAVVYTSNRDGRIEGYDLDDGKRTFNVSLKDKLVAGVAVNVSSIIAVTTGGEVLALDREDGSEKWRSSTGSAISASPALNDQLIVVRTVDGKVIGLNALTGDQVWAIERPVAALSIGLDAPGLVASEGVVNGFSNGRVLASNIYNGSPFWEVRAFRPGGKNEIERLIDIDASPIMAGQLVIVGAYQGGMAAYLLRDGSEVWRNESASTRKPIAKSGVMLAVTGPESEVSMVAQDTGKTRWKKTVLRGFGLSGPVILDDAVMVGSLDGSLYFFDLFDGRLLSKYKLSSTRISSLHKVADAVLVYSASSGSLSLVQP